MIVYEPERYGQAITTQYINQVPKINQIIPELQPQATLKHKQIYVPTDVTAAKKKNTEKYNLYSCLDEPFERFKAIGCKGMTCPSN